MIKIEIFKGRAGYFKSFTVSGHSEYGNYGSDIVCSAVSALTQTTIIGLKSVAGISVDYSMEDGFLSCKLPFVNDRDKFIKANAIFDTMVLGLKNIKANYSDYICLIIKEEV